MLSLLCGGCMIVLGTNDSPGKTRYVCTTPAVTNCSRCSIGLCHRHSVRCKEEPGSLVCDRCDAEMTASQQFSEVSMTLGPAENQGMCDLDIELVRNCGKCGRHGNVKKLCLHTFLQSVVHQPPMMFCESCIADGNACPVCNPPRSRSSSEKTLAANK